MGTWGQTRKRGALWGVGAEMGSVCGQEPERRHQKLTEAWSTPERTGPLSAASSIRHSEQRSISVAEAPCLWAASGGPVPSQPGGHVHVPAVREHRTDRLTAPGSPAAALLSCFQLRTRTSGSWVGGPGPRLLRSPHSLLAPSYPRSSYWGTSLCLKGRGLTLALTLAPKGVKGTSLETPCLQLPWSLETWSERWLC